VDGPATQNALSFKPLVSYDRQTFSGDHNIAMWMCNDVGETWRWIIVTSHCISGTGEG